MRIRAARRAATGGTTGTVSIVPSSGWLQSTPGLRRRSNAGWDWNRSARRSRSVSCSKPGTCDLPTQFSGRGANRSRSPATT